MKQRKRESLCQSEKETDEKETIQIIIKNNPFFQLLMNERFITITYTIPYILKDIS